MSPRIRESRHPRLGYTLLEILVVLAIVVVLGSLSLVAVLSIRRSVQERHDRNHWLKMRKIGVILPREAPVRVLFIGNSYTMGNSLPQMIHELANAGEVPEIEVDSHLVGGATFEKHWNDGQAVQKIRQGGWDFVVLQEQSMRPILDRPRMHRYARLLVKESQEVGAIPLFFLTWARQHLPQTQPRLNRAYTTIAQAMRAEVAPVGPAWASALKENPNRQLHTDDRSHPSPAGSYLAACVFYAALFHANPEGLPGTVSHQGQVLAQVPQAEARSLQQHAWRAFQDMQREFQPDIALRTRRR